MIKSENKIESRLTTERKKIKVKNVGFFINKIDNL